jgi:alpha-tubulin suppressor-like RCC1 family protein
LFTIPIDGRVFCWGSNTHGELGRISKHSAKAKEVAGLPNTVIAIRCGDQRCAAITSDGFCYFWGRLCSKDMMKDNHAPQLIEEFEGEADVWVKDAACGRTHFAILEDCMMSWALTKLKREIVSGFPSLPVLHEVLEKVPARLLLPLQIRAVFEVRKVMKNSFLYL